MITRASKALFYALMTVAVLGGVVYIADMLIVFSTMINNPWAFWGPVVLLFWVVFAVIMYLLG